MIFPPRVGGLHLLGFIDKYVTCSARQVKGVTVVAGEVTVDLELPVGMEYSFCVLNAGPLTAAGRGADILEVRRDGGQTVVRFRANAPGCSLLLRG